MQSNEVQPAVATTWTELLHLRMKGLDKRSPKYDKLQVFKFASEHGIPTPEVIRVYSDPREFRSEHGPGSFILKPADMSSKKGVMMLHRIAGGYGYWDSIRSRRLTASQIRAEQAENAAAWALRSKRPFALLMQEVVTGENGERKIPFDYKFYTFNGKIEFILQIDRNHKKAQMAFFGDDFRPLHVGKEILTGWTKVDPGEPKVPECANEMLQVVREASKLLKTPFVSLDMYAHVEKGPMLGEITKTPGGPYYGRMFKFSPAFDQHLGDAWSRAIRDFNEPIPLFTAAQRASLPEAHRPID